MSEMPPPLIALHQVHKRFDGRLETLRDVSPDARAGEFVALLGPSGCGKSTALRLVAGLDAASTGSVRSPALDHRGGDTAFGFQEPTLMPWASVFDNVRLPLRPQGQRRAACEAAVRAVLASVGLSEFERAYPAQLSGGMKMHASIARALVTQPRVLLMDEPFAALDDITRQKLNADLLRWWAEQQLAALFVTHSVAEVAIDEPYPRTPAFRSSAAFVESCRRVSEALEQASA